MIPQNEKIARYLATQCKNDPITKSIRKCPFQIQSGAEILLLQGATEQHAKLVQEVLDNFSERAPFIRPIAHRIPHSVPTLERPLLRPQTQHNAADGMRRREEKTSTATERPKKSRRVEIRRYAAQQAQPRESPSDVTIIVDHRERTNRSHSSFAHWMRASGGVKCVDAQLASGDFMFMDTHSGYIYPAVVERKTLADLAGSIITPRLAEQKRLMCSMELPLSIILVEGNLRPGGPDATNLGSDDLKRIHSAIATASVVNGFNVYHCPSRDDTLSVLKAIGSFLASRFSNISHVKLANLEEINSLRDVIEIKSVFPNMLANISGCSPETACAIAAHFKSPVALHQAVDLATRNPREELEFVREVQRLKHGSKASGAELSLMLMNLFGNENFDV